MKYVVCDQVVLSKAPEGPLAAYIGSFAEFVSAQGYALNTIRRQVRLCAGFSRWLKRKRVESRSIRAEHVEKYLRYRARQVRICLGDAAALRHFIDFLRGERVIPAEKVTALQLTPVEHCTQAYEQYLRETCALAEATILNYVPFIRSFLKGRFGDGPVMLSRLCAHDVVRFVQRQAPRLHRKRAKLMSTALRSFFRYTHYHGDVALDLAAAVPVVANWSMPSIPRAISADQVHRLLASIDQHTAIGRRDYAILLLLARLGLRASEVAFLELDDIDWNTGTLNVIPVVQAAIKWHSRDDPLPFGDQYWPVIDGLDPLKSHEESMESTSWPRPERRRPDPALPRRDSGHTSETNAMHWS